MRLYFQIHISEVEFLKVNLLRGVLKRFQLDPLPETSISGAKYMNIFRYVKETWDRLY